MTLPPPVLPASPTPRKRRGWVKPAAIGVGGLVLFGAAVSALAPSEDEAETASTDAPVKTTGAPTTTTTTVPATTTEAPTTTTEPAERVWGPENFEIGLIVIEDQCFGSAGGLVTVEPEVFIDFLEEWDETATITFDILGGENGVETYSIEVDPDATYGGDRPLIGTAVCGDTLTAEVSRVLIRP